MQKLAISLFLIFLAIFPFYPSDNSKIKLSWALIHTVNGEEAKTLDITKEMKFNENDTFKFYFLPILNSYIYLYCLDSNKELSLLFPKKIEEFDNKLYFNKSYFIPEDETWISLDNKTGKETFYILVSKKRLTKLEKITNKYIISSTDEIKRIKLKQEIIDEIKMIRQKNSKYSVIAEKPTSITGTTKGLENLNVISVEADNFYSKTIELQH